MEKSHSDERQEYVLEPHRSPGKKTALQIDLERHRIWTLLQNLGIVPEFLGKEGDGFILGLSKKEARLVSREAFKIGMFRPKDHTMRVDPQRMNAPQRARA